MFEPFLDYKLADEPIVETYGMDPATTYTSIFIFVRLALDLSHVID